jgi:type IV pilus assembly protein PilM
VLGTGGRALTEAIASTLEVPFDTAESVKRQIGTVDDDVVTQARTAIERPLGVLLDEIRSSLDYYRNQPGASRLLRVQLTGGAAQLTDLRDRLGALLGVPVVEAQPREQLQVSDIGFDESELPRLDPYLPAAVGLALGDSTGLPVMNLLPGRGGRRMSVSTLSSSRVLIGAIVGAVVLIGVLGALWLSKKHDANDLQSQAKQEEAKTAVLESQVQRLSASSDTQQQLRSLQAATVSALSTDVSWSSLLNELAHTMPNTVWLTSFQGSVQPGTGTGTARPSGTGTPSTGSTSGTTTPGAQLGGGLQGNVTVAATGLDYPAVADWIKRLEQIAAYDNVWVPSASSAPLGDRTVVNFQSTADLTDAARSQRSQNVAGGSK